MKFATIIHNQELNIEKYFFSYICFVSITILIKEKDAFILNAHIREAFSLVLPLCKSHTRDAFSFTIPHSAWL